MLQSRLHSYADKWLGNRQHRTREPQEEVEQHRKLARPPPSVLRPLPAECRKPATVLSADMAARHSLAMGLFPEPQKPPYPTPGLQGPGTHLRHLARDTPA
ncbi:hypothetical protein SKAU_G00185870 [Synaphobranchus kaupii]|uniref:Uncharacterized protein n=1 Tax=Synaphobranchus kaupii TaxID=118154 RepID=A0A9Q1IWR6_SYNKA|nr:hypothetical protein SKAU_G00185870 [Synaphobranchus kaupii]